MNDVFIFESLRTPRGKGKASGSLHEVKPINLLTIVLKAMREQLSLDTSKVDDAVIGCVTPIGDQGADIAKAALLYSGWSNDVPGVQVNRFCASGLEAVNLAAMKVRSGWEQLVLAGGVESMSRVPIGSDGGALVFDPAVISRVGYIPQGISADLIATREGFTRQMVDSYAVQSQQRAAYAQENGYFDRSIVSVYDHNGLPVLEKDEYLRPSTTVERLAKLPLAFEQLGHVGFDEMALMRYPSVEKINHVHTAGNSSGIVDGAAVVLIGSESIGKELGLNPRVKIRSVATVSAEPTIMLQGPTPAANKALTMAGMEAKDIDLWEMNEAFASAVLKFQKDLKIDNDKLNVNGGAIALGHPLGATGAMLIGTLIDEMERRDVNTGLVTLCVGGGMGVATIVERV